MFKILLILFGIFIAFMLLFLYCALIVASRYDDCTEKEMLKRKIQEEKNEYWNNFGDKYR